MNALKVFLVLLLVICEAKAFTTRKRDRRPAFKGASPVVIESSTSKEDQPTMSDSTGAIMFAMHGNPMTPAVAIIHEDTEDEIDVGYGTALVSCLLSLALGFGLGYGT
jgi:hypothetical protein